MQVHTQYYSIHFSILQVGEKRVLERLVYWVFEQEIKHRALNTKRKLLLLSGVDIQQEQQNGSVTKPIIFGL